MTLHGGSGGCCLPRLQQNVQFFSCFPFHSLLLVELTRYRLHGWSARWIRNLLTGHTQLVVINSFYSGWQPVTREVLQVLIPGPMLFCIIINYLYDRTESTRTKFADDTKLGNDVDMLEGRAILQRHVDWLENWASRTKFNKGKCKIVHLGHHNQSPVWARICVAGK